MAVVQRMRFSRHPALIGSLISLHSMSKFLVGTKTMETGDYDREPRPEVHRERSETYTWITAAELFNKELTETVVLAVVTFFASSDGRTLVVGVASFRHSCNSRKFMSDGTISPRADPPHPA